jgi:hypothetical protein
MNMHDNRCPNCENDITTTVTSTVIAMLQDGDTEPRIISCPHCAENLNVSAQVSTTLMQTTSSR